MKNRKSSEAEASAGAAGKKHYKLWILSAIVLVAVWFMFTGSLTLRWSSSSYNDFDPANFDDLDVLEVEEREKVVRQMWDVYSRRHSTRKLPRFWSEAFQAGYEHLVSDIPAIRDAAVSEIAKMSLKQLPIQLQSHSHVQSPEGSRKIKEAEGSDKMHNES
ncbi:uncharacterized protein LOC107460107 [Arachis duranensis]|uniref:Uncharacterized protein LOC107460107 n=1 Tax=Arachis duranensis TaxID=130453 RepID=A0A6P4BZB9_ARADU|nr:uncharacterized protein LOC107460107 [Arachis duranensis]XP_057731050.1 uncharacterized protein LOC130946353 [Arachis stenosperma]